MRHIESCLKRQDLVLRRRGRKNKSSKFVNREFYREYRAYLKVSMAYAIMLVGKKVESVHCGTQQAPELQLRGFLYSVCGKVITTV